MHNIMLKIDRTYERIRSKTKITIKEYYLPELDKWLTIKSLKFQLRKLNMTIQDYFDKYFVKDKSIKICQLTGCTNETAFINLTLGYRPGCCYEHSKKIAGIKSSQFYKDNPDVVYKLSQTISATYDRPGKREAFSMAMKKSLARPQVKHKISIKSKAWHSKPEVKLKFSTLLKQQYATGQRDNVVFKSFGHGHYVYPNMQLYYGKTKLIDNKHVIWLPSDLEHRILNQIEQLNLHYAHDHVKIFYDDNSGRTYTPDFEITFNNGSKLLIECKPVNKINNDDVQYKSYIAKQFVALHKEYLDYIFILDTESYYDNCLMSKISQYL